MVQHLEPGDGCLEFGIRLEGFGTIVQVRCCVPIVGGIEVGLGEDDLLCEPDQLNVSQEMGLLFPAQQVPMCHGTRCATLHHVNLRCSA